MKLVSHLTITCSFLRSIYYGDEPNDINHLIELEPNKNYTYYSGDIYFLHQYNYNFFVKFNIGKEEHILEYNFEKYKSKYDLYFS